MPLLDHLRRLSLLVVTGKGGVGKSTFSATLGQILAHSGKRVLLLEVEPRESLFQLLSLPPHFCDACPLDNPDTDGDTVPDFCDPCPEDPFDTCQP